MRIINTSLFVLAIIEWKWVLSTVKELKLLLTIFYALLTHCRLLAPYYIMDLDLHRFNCWLVTKTMMTSSNGNIFRVTGHFMQGIHRSPVNSPHKGQWRGALMFSLIYALNKRLSKQSWGWWFETLPHPWRHCNGHLNLILSSTECLGRYFHNIVLGIKTFFHKKTCSQWVENESFVNTQPIITLITFQVNWMKTISVNARKPQIWPILANWNKFLETELKPRIWKLSLTEESIQQPNSTPLVLILTYSLFFSEHFIIYYAITIPHLFGGRLEWRLLLRKIRVQWPLLLTWFNFNPSMDK